MMADDNDDATTSAAAATAAAQAMLVKLSTDGVPKLFCPICNKALVSLAGYVKHVKKHEPPGGFLCRFCDARFCSEDELKKHRETQHTTIACRLCKDVTFTNEDDYRMHIRDIHQGVDRELFRCDKCGATYKTIEPFKRHIETECGTIKPYKCEICPMAFVTKYNLKQHLDNHSGELKFCCSYCGRNFKQKARLVEHERTHTGEKPYKCDVCGKRFSHRESIVTHSSIHTGIRLVECKCCSSRFSCYSNLLKHRRNRPETCGLPEYDPPRNRVRKFPSRIPAFLNPTSEIKVVNQNKIIKPKDLEKANAIKKEMPDKVKKAAPIKVKTKYTARKRTGGGGVVFGSAKAPIRKPPTKRKVAKKAIVESEESDGAIDFDDNETEWEDAASVDDEEEVVEKVEVKIEKPKRQRKILQAEIIEAPPAITTQWSDESEDDYVPDFEPEDSDYDAAESEDIKLPMPTVNIKKETEDVTTKIDIEPIDDFEYSALDCMVTVKSEDGDSNNIFSEKDKILECLLNEGDYNRLERGKAEDYHSPRHKNHNQSELDDILEEDEIMSVKDEDSYDEEYPLEDMLEVTHEYSSAPLVLDNVEKDCYVVLEDVVHRYPDLKTQTTIKVSRNCKPFYSNSADIKKLMRKALKRKYRPRDDNNPEKKRKITADEIKRKIKLAKKRDKTYQCPHCIKIYYMRKPFEKHLRENHKKTDDELKEMFKDEITELPDENVFKCYVCDKIYMMEKRLIDHIPKHGPDGRLIHKCPCYCTMYFATREEAQKHAQEAHREQLWCEICQKFMTGVDALKTHKVRIHGAKGPELKRNLVCDKCGKKFMGRTQLTDHVRSDCGRVPIYECEICGKCLTTAGILKTHMLLHKDDRPFQCDQCGKTFKIKAQYKTHIRFFHSDEKPFKCHLCPKAYPYRESLLTHMAVHTGIKRFLCNGCGKRFTCVSNLQAHRKVHAETCGMLPLNAKATQYMGVQKGNLLLGAKPEPGLDYVLSQTLVAKEVYTQDLNFGSQDINMAMQASNSMSAGLPLNYANDIILL